MMKLNKKFKITKILGMCLFLTSLVSGQTLTSMSLEEAYVLLENNYPVLQNDRILTQIYQKELEQLDKATLPALYLKGDTRLQSEAMKLEPEEGMMAPFEIID